MDVLTLAVPDSPECSLSIQRNFRQPGPGGIQNCACARGESMPVFPITPVALLE